jgi:aminopeptidase N
MNIKGESPEVTMRKANSINYKIRLEPDLHKFTFNGEVEILIRCNTPPTEITLNILELAIWSCKAKRASEFVACPFCVLPETEELRVSLPREMEADITLRIQYTGLINDRMAGFYRSRHASGGKAQYIAVTQFEERDARRAFPCFDHPAQKATFDIEMIVDGGLAAISNGRVSQERPAGEGKKQVTFMQTPKMSTYLLFFGVGGFEFLEDPGEVLIRVAAMPGRVRYARQGLEFGRKALQFCEAYYDIDYPLQKLDLMAIPDFAFGAMENWGAITFRENLLLYYPHVTSSAGKERIYEVIAHEMAHQWFGNLVTPSDWKYLWLNESFATYFGSLVVNHYHPEWEVWQQFLNGQTQTALDRDALLKTVPIEIPGGDHVAINVSTAPIIYNKGGSVLRQVEGLIGPEKVKEGLRHYLKKFAYACASSHDLWESFQRVSKAPVPRMMKSWVEQPGFPLVEVEREGNGLVLTQRRFTYLPNQSKQTWLIPMRIRVFREDGTTTVLSTLMGETTTRMEMGEAAAAYKVNDMQTGFYRVKYRDPSALSGLGERVSKKILPPEDRWGLQNDLYALVKSGEVLLEDYLDLLSNFAHEDGYLPIMGIVENLLDAYLVMEGPRRDAISTQGRRLLERSLPQMGYEPRLNEKHTTSILRDQVLFSAVLWGSQAAEDFALGKFDSLMKGETLHPDLMKGIMQVGALRGSVEVFDWFDKRFNLTESEHERMNILAAMAKFSDENLIERSLQYALDKVPSRNRFIPIVSMASNPCAIPHLWDWYRDHRHALEGFHPLHYERVLAGILPVCGLGKEEAVKAFFDDYVRGYPGATEAIELALERLEINARMRSR